MLLEKFLDGIDSQHTRRAYRTDLTDFFSFWGKKPGVEVLAEISKDDVRSYIRSLQSEGKSESTQRRRFSALRRFFDWLMDQGLVDGNPARACRVKISESTEPDASSHDRAASLLSKSEVETLVHATDDAGETAVRDRGLILTILYGALRRSEVAAMNVQHVRPLGRHWVIDVPSAQEWSSAYVKIPMAVVEAIEAVQSRYGINEGALWRSLSNRNRGARMTPDAIYKAVRRTGQRAGFKTVTVETLRQTGLSLALQGGATRQQVQLHGRLESAAAIERYADPKNATGRLSESAVDFVELEI